MNSFFYLEFMISNSLKSIVSRMVLMFFSTTSFSVFGSIKNNALFSYFCYPSNKESSKIGNDLVFETAFPLLILKSNFSNFNKFFVGIKPNIVTNFFFFSEIVSCKFKLVLTPGSSMKLKGTISSMR